MALATTVATDISKGIPSSLHFFNALYVSLGSRSFITFSLNTMLPNMVGTWLDASDIKNSSFNELRNFLVSNKKEKALWEEMIPTAPLLMGVV